VTVAGHVYIALRQRLQGSCCSAYLGEVLSPSTAAFDRGAKFAAYRLAESLREMVFIDPERQVMDVYRKGDDGLWVLHPFAPTETVHLASVDLALPPATLWAEVGA
tara:strand:- start:56 stop:373 length:318 start_codon:yes stop_codon:yes gene_type:complete